MNFLKQIKNTTFGSRYEINKEIDIGKREYEEAKKVFSNFADLIIKELTQKNKAGNKKHPNNL